MIVVGVGGEQLPEPPGPVTETEALTVAVPPPTAVAVVELLKLEEVLVSEVGLRETTPEVGDTLQLTVELVVLVVVTLAVIKAVLLTASVSDVGDKLTVQVGAGGGAQF